MSKKKIQLVAEVGCNHMGQINLAKTMIDQAKRAGADYVKFQKRDNKNLLSKKQYNEKHPVPHNSFGKTYGEHREHLEFDISTHKKIFNYCKKRKIKYSCSAWDIKSAQQLSKICKQYIKIPSATNLNFQVLDFLCSKYFGDIHISTGMTSEKEVNTIFEFMKKRKRLNNLVLYSCVSAYPVDYSDVCLLDVKRLTQKYGKYIKAVGFSGHHRGVSIDNCTIALGATWVERHFTFDRSAKGTDHAASLELDGFMKLRGRIDSTSLALNYKPKKILKCEKFQRSYLKNVVNRETKKNKQHN
jgi:N-acetylneuraminate synthase